MTELGLTSENPCFSEVDSGRDFRERGELGPPGGRSDFREQDAFGSDRRAAAAHPCHCRWRWGPRIPATPRPWPGRRCRPRPAAPTPRRSAPTFAWLDTVDVDGDPLTDAAARDWTVRDYRTHLAAVLKRSNATVNNALAAVDDFYTRAGLGTTLRCPRPRHARPPRRRPPPRCAAPSLPPPWGAGRHPWRGGPKGARPPPLRRPPPVPPAHHRRPREGAHPAAYRPLIRPRPG